MHWKPDADTFVQRDKCDYRYERENPFILCPRSEASRGRPHPLCVRPSVFWWQTSLGDFCSEQHNSARHPVLCFSNKNIRWLKLMTLCENTIRAVSLCLQSIIIPGHLFSWDLNVKSTSNLNLTTTETFMQLMIFLQEMKQCVASVFIHDIGKRLSAAGIITKWDLLFECLICAHTQPLMKFPRPVGSHLDTLVSGLTRTGEVRHLRKVRWCINHPPLSCRCVFLFSFRQRPGWNASGRVPQKLSLELCSLLHAAPLGWIRLQSTRTTWPPYSMVFFAESGVLQLQVTNQH